MGKCVVSDDPQGTTGAGVYLYVGTIEDGSEDPRARRVLPTLFAQVRLVYDVDTCRTQRDRFGGIVSPSLELAWFGACCFVRVPCAHSRQRAAPIRMTRWG
eukprot:1080339-Pleurochrysis_carterae.AAC.1